MNTEYNYLDYAGDVRHYDPERKAVNIMHDNLYKVNELSQFITYDNLPDTIPQRVLEKYLILNGSAFFTEINGNYYIVTGGAGGILDYNFEPTRYVFSNPYLQYTGMAKLENTPQTKDYGQYSNNDGILIRNDSMSLGCYPIIDKYNTLIAELDLTIRNAIVLYRASALSSAGSIKTANAINEWFERLQDGTMSAVVDSSFTDSDSGSIRVQPLMNASAGNYLSSLIEMRQYLVSTLNNKLGINCNFNMKREALSTAECALNDQSVVPLILDMFDNRLEAVELINRKYGLNIVVKLNNLWQSNVDNVENGNNISDEKGGVESVEEAEEKPDVQ